MKKLLAIVPLMLILAACSDENSFKFNDIEKDSGKTEEVNKEEVKTETDSKEEVTPETESKDEEKEPEVTEEASTEEEVESTEDADSTEDVEEKKPNESADEAEEDGVTDGTQGEAAVVENKGLVEYMPKRGMKKVFLLDKFEIVRTVKAVKGNRLLESITFGDVETIQISEWTPTKLTMLFNNSEDTAGVTIDKFEATSAPEVYIDRLNEQTGSQAWKVVQDDLTLKVPAGTYKDVIVIEQTIISETSNQQTISRFYYAKGLGLVKEEVITKNGDNESASIMELNRIE